MREMKDSGVPWIGLVPKKWDVAPLWRTLRRRNEDNHPTEMVLSLYRDLGIIPKDSRDDNHNVTSLDTTNYKFVRKGDFVINKMKAWQGSMAVSGYQGIVSPAYHVCEFINDKVYPHYLHYLLRNPSYLPEYDRLSTGLRVGQWDLSYDDFKAIPHLIPPYDEQQRIADFLDRKCADIDNVLEKTKASIEEYKKLKLSVITEAVTKGIRGARPMKDSGIEWIGEIPTDWAVRKLKYSINILAGYAFSSDNFKTEGIKLLRGVNVTPKGTRWDDVVFWDSSLVDDNIKQYELKIGDLVLGLDRPWIKEGTRVAFINGEDLPCLLLQRVCRIRPKEKIDPRFIYLALSSKSFEDALTTDTTGVSIPHISTDQVLNYPVAMPNYQEQTEICDHIDKQCSIIDSLIVSKEMFITELESYKKSLIYEYVTGKKEVPSNA